MMIVHQQIRIRIRIRRILIDKNPHPMEADFSWLRHIPKMNKLI